MGRGAHLKKLLNKKFAQQLLDDAIELSKNKNYKATILCEPQMGNRGLYPNVSYKNNIDSKASLTMNFLTFCDGQTSLLEIADKLNVPIWDLYSVADILNSHGLIEDNV